MVKRVSVLSSDNNIPKLEYQDIYKGYGVLNKDISKKLDSRKGLLFESGDLLFGFLSPENKNYMKVDFNGIAVGDFWLFKSQQNNPDFIYTYFEHPDFIKSFKVQSGTKMPRANWTLVSSVHYWIPQIKEQKIIGKFFSNYQSNQLNKTRYVDKLKQIKDILLSTLFINTHKTEPEIRFKKFHDKWNIKVLGDISEKVREKNKELKYTETFTNSAKNGIVSQNDYFNKAITNDLNIGVYYIVEPDSFVHNSLVSENAPAGPMNRNNLGRTGIMSPLYFIFKVHGTSLDFVEYFFKSTYWHQFIQENGDIGARSNRFSIKDNTFFELPISMPPLSEQTKIGKLFKTLDKLISLQNTEINILKELKKTAMKMLLI
ncbi:restriction endonuclease subunit S [Mycoplasma sp. Ms02]|uniref:restriction endonuclease subunit S n=1 Tax=Mycoplasma sp. Ms02 TaxID=353851 RepID=UPI001C8939DE|nr:restriction endonuclease subunit S [Mycoplasma sp. Ms02]QZE12492.1 restriction endonuclease subunit S [Mycoplasma sp. Ms02]